MIDTDVKGITVMDLTKRLGCTIDETNAYLIKYYQEGKIKVNTVYHCSKCVGYIGEEEGVQGKVSSTYCVSCGETKGIGFLKLLAKNEESDLLAK